MEKKNILKKLLALSCLFSVVVSFQLKAEEVKKSDVKKVAVNAFSYYSGEAQDEFKIVQEIPFTLQDTALLYAYNFEKGFIIIAADNVAEPVLGFGLESKFDFENMPPALQFLLDSYREEMLFAKRQKSKVSQEISAKWEEYLNPNPIKTLYNQATYLIETKWNQNGGNAVGSPITYNYYCPITVQGKTILGCGAVALAQILKFWSCRVHPQGSIICVHPNGGTIVYELSSQNYCWGCMLPYQANFENALLLMHCAVAIESEFGVDGTTSHPYKIPNKLSQHFGFTSTHYYKNTYSGDWISLLKTNIDERKPAFYAGKRTENNGKVVGHGWVVDGYNSSNYFHCNFGWAGSGDGWYLLSNITPNGKNYNENQEAIVNIYPTYYTNTLLKNMIINSNTYTGHSITVDNCTIQNNAKVILKAECGTEIFGHFTVPVGATLEIK